ncbi:MAG: sulfurtransferase TusA family protein [Nitrospirales bacterium]|nr:sulfurtransferase TusA family protein [Nitrospirales bacterium]
MTNTENLANDHRPQAELDLKGVICPYNFVKTKLKLESMQAGEILAVILDDGDPIHNVPNSIENEGHTILSREKCGEGYRVFIQKRVDRD